MDTKWDSRKALYVLVAIAAVFAASLLWGHPQAHAASSTVAYVTDSGGTIKGRFSDLQAAFDSVNNGETVDLIKDINTQKTYKINRGKTFGLWLQGHTITSDDASYNPILRIENGTVTLYSGISRNNSQPGLIGTKLACCIRLDSGCLNNTGQRQYGLSRRARRRRVRR